MARIGLRIVGVCSVTLGLGFGLNLIPNVFLAFFLSYTVLQDS